MLASASILAFPSLGLADVNSAKRLSDPASASLGKPRIHLRAPVGFHMGYGAWPHTLRHGTFDELQLLVNAFALSASVRVDWSTHIIHRPGEDRTAVVTFGSGLWLGPSFSWQRPVAPLRLQALFGAVAHLGYTPTLGTREPARFESHYGAAVNVRLELPVRYRPKHGRHDRQPFFQLGWEAYPEWQEVGSVRSWWSLHFGFGVTGQWF